MGDRARQPGRSLTTSDAAVRPAPRERPIGRLPDGGATLVALQRTAGNSAVSLLLQRQHPPATLPPPAASGVSAPADPEVLYFEGHALRFDRAVLRGVLARIEVARGLDARSEFMGRFRTLSSSPAGLTSLRGTERPGLYQDLVRGLDDAGAQLDHEHAEFAAAFERTGNDAARQLLDRSEQTLKAEVERLGITGQVLRGPGGGVPDFTLGNAGAGGTLKAAAARLAGPAQAAEDTGRASAEALNRFNAAQVGDPFGLLTRPLAEESEARRKRWMEAEEAYEQARRTAVAEQPSLAMWAQEPGAAGKLRELSTMDDRALANEVATAARKKLDNIAQVRPKIGTTFSVWSQPHLRRVTLDQMQATPLQREVVERKARAAARAAGDDALLFSLLAIGLGLVAAIPTGGSSLLAGIGLAAAAMGAGLSLYQLGELSSAYSLAIAANATDFDKAKAISQEDPSGMQLALDLVAAIGDVFGAAAAFKALKGALAATKAGDVAAAVKLSGIADSVGVKGAAKRKIIGEAVAGLPDAAVEEVGRTVAKGGGMTVGEYLSKMTAGVAEHSQFKKELEAAGQLLEHVRGRIPDHARAVIQQGKVRVFNEAALIEVYGPDKGAKLWQKYHYAEGFYSEKVDRIFLRSGASAEDLAGSLVHEATHRMGSSNPLRGNDFMSEAVAEFAERDFYMTLYAEGGPLAGKPVTSPRIKQFLTMSDEQLMVDIERRYFKAKKELPESKRGKFLMDYDVTPEKVVEQIFTDIAADYQSTLPRAGP